MGKIKRRHTTTSAVPLIHRADRGSQYAAGDPYDILHAAAVIRSIGRKANSRDEGADPVAR
jgi:hypothetical protein